MLYHAAGIKPAATMVRNVKMQTSETCTLEVFRYHPETDTEPRFQTYTVPFMKDWVVTSLTNPSAAPPIATSIGLTFPAKIAPPA